MWFAIFGYPRTVKSFGMQLIRILMIGHSHIGPCMLGARELCEACCICLEWANTQASIASFYLPMVMYRFEEDRSEWVG